MMIIIIIVCMKSRALLPHEIKPQHRLPPTGPLGLLDLGTVLSFGRTAGHCRCWSGRSKSRSAGERTLVIDFHRCLFLDLPTAFQLLSTLLSTFTPSPCVCLSLPSLPCAFQSIGGQQRRQAAHRGPGTGVEVPPAAAGRDTRPPCVLPGAANQHISLGVLHELVC